MKIIVSEENKIRNKIEREYQNNNEKIVNNVISGDISISQAIRELNKNLGNTLVSLSNIRNSNTQ